MTKKQQQAIDRFNAECPVGSEVIVKLDSGEEKRTTVRYPASLLGGHTPVGWIVGVVGCYDLTRIRKAEPQ